MTEKIKSITWILVIYLLQACNNNADQAMGAADAQLNKDSLSTNEMATITPDTLNNNTHSIIENLHNEIALQINMAKLAIDHSNDPGIKNLGKTINDQQTELTNKLSDMALERNITFTSSNAVALKSILEMFQSKKGRDFDTSYLNWVTETTQGSIDFYKKNEHASDINELQLFMKNAVPILIQHYDAANALKNK